MKVSASIVPDSCRLFFVVCRGVSGCLFLGREQFPFRDTRNLAENGVSLHGTSVEWQFPVRDTGNFAEKGVSLHRTSVFLYPAVAIQVFLLEMVCRCTESQKERRFLFAIQGISRKMVYRCTEPLHETSARNLCTEPLRRTAARNRYAEQRYGLEGKLRFAFCCRRERVRNCF